MSESAHSELSVVNRMAKAMLESRDWTTDTAAEEAAPSGWDSLSEDWKEAYRTMARAALIALKEPTRAMTDASYMATSMSRNPSPPLSPRNKARVRWNAMIDAALTT